MTFETSKLQSLHIISENASETVALKELEENRYTLPFKLSEMKIKWDLVSLLIS